MGRGTIRKILRSDGVVQRYRIKNLKAFNEKYRKTSLGFARTELLIRRTSVVNTTTDERRLAEVRVWYYGNHDQDPRQVFENFVSVIRNKYWKEIDITLEADDTISVEDHLVPISEITGRKNIWKGAVIKQGRAYFRATSKDGENWE